MSYDVQALFDVSSCRVVLAGDINTAKRLEADIAARKPEYYYEENKVLGPTRIGPITLKNNNTLLDIWMKTKGAKEKGVDFVKKQAAFLDTSNYASRRPRALSTLQRMRTSILYDVLNGRSKFLLSDGDTELGPALRVTIHMVASWLKDYEGFGKSGCDLIWVTCMTARELMEKLGEKDARDGFYSFFTVEDQQVVACDKAGLLAACRPAEKPTVKQDEQTLPEKAANREMTPEEMYYQGRRYDTVSGMGRKDATNDPKEAFRWYKAAAEGGNLSAQNLTGLFYQCGFGGCEVDLEKALHWYAAAAFHGGYSKRTATADTTTSYQAAQRNLKALLVQLPNGKELVRSQVGDRAEPLIKQAVLEKAMDSTPGLDPESVRKDLEAFRKKYW